MNEQKLQEIFFQNLSSSYFLSWLRHFQSACYIASMFFYSMIPLIRNYQVVSRKFIKYVRKKFLFPVHMIFNVHRSSHDVTKHQFYFFCLGTTLSNQQLTFCGHLYCLTSRLYLFYMQIAEIYSYSEERCPVLCEARHFSSRDVLRPQS